MGRSDRADVGFAQPVEVAAAIRSGTLSASEAVLLGQVEVSGDPMSLLAHREVLAALDEAFRGVEEVD